MRRSTPTPGSIPPIRWAGVLAMLLLAGCADPERSDRDFEREGAEVFQPITPGDKIDASDAWTIVIVAYRGSQRDARARQDLLKVRNEAGLVGAFVEDRGDSSVIAYGRYTNPEDSQAQRDLKLVREFEFEGSNPFAGATLTPPSAAKAGSMPEYDLRNVKARLGDWVIYTLEIGGYGGRHNELPSAKELVEFRAAAEQAVVQLRREGEQAFYYHGPTSSQVLIGAWGERDFEASDTAFMPPKYEAAAIRQARERFPYLLFNGQAMRDRTRDRLIASRLVGVPDR